MSLRTLILFTLICFAGGAHAQADQEVVSVTPSATTVAPGTNVTYTIQMSNHGPNPAVNGGLNVNLGSALTYVSHTIPGGWQCYFFGNAISCITPSWAPGGATITLVVHFRRLSNS